MSLPFRLHAEVVGEELVFVLYIPEELRSESGDPIRFPDGIAVTGAQLLGSDGSPQAEIGDIAGAVNRFLFQGSLPGGGPVLVVVGADTNIPANFAAKGNAGHYHGNGNGTLHAMRDPGVGVLTRWASTIGAIAGGVVIWTPDGADADIPAVFGPKGSGFWSAQAPDGLVSGGNTRGIYSVDMQRIRNAATQVASGDSAIIAGGRNNTASGAYSHAEGDTCTASGWAAFASGSKCDATQTLSSARGQCALANARGKDAVAGGGFSNVRGSSQVSRQVLQAATSDATPGVMTGGGEALSATSAIALQNYSAFGCEIIVTARSSAGVVAMFKGDGLWKRDANAASTTLEFGAMTAVHNPGGWAVALDVDTTYGCGLVRVTGAASTAIRWTAEVRGTELVH